MGLAEKEDSQDKSLRELEENEDQQFFGESKRDAFLRISTSRVNRLVDDIRILSNLGDMSRYTYTEEDVNKMFGHIEEAVSKAKKQFIKNEPFMPPFKWGEN